jgi:hypothetical protein
VEEANKREPFEPIKTTAEYTRRVEHGIITVREVQARSDIVVMPPSVQHVVWQRDGSIVPAAAPSRKAEEAPYPIPVPDEERPIDDWPLLAEDMNFESEIGRVPMCRPGRACGPGEDCPDLIPCERADELSCYRVKQGDYCLENNE